MTLRTAFPALLVLLCAAALAHGKGPKDDTPSKKYQNKGGYSGGAIFAKSKYQSTPTEAVQQPAAPAISRIPSQTPIMKKYGAAIPPIQSPPSSPTAPVGKAPVGKKEDRYSTKRPASAVTGPMGPPIGVAGRDSPSAIRFPARPVTVSPPVTPVDEGKQRPPAQRPPIVFYPKATKGTKGQETAARPSAPERPAPRQPPAEQPPRQPSATVFKSKYYGPSLRPESQTTTDQSRTRGPIIVNRPVTINQSTTNITRETNNINNWYTNNHWQNRVTVNSRHWNDRPWWYEPDYGDWHHGHWHAHYVQGGPRRDDWGYVDTSEHAWLNGLAVWGVGNLIYRTGYQFYVNPYCVRPIVLGKTTIDYSRPIAVQLSDYERAFADDEAKAAELRAGALQLFEVARRAFYLKDLSAAYENVNRAIALMPDDASMHEFRSLVLFAAGRYAEAAEVVHAVLAVAPGWDWTTLSGLYRDTDDYARQLLSLGSHVKENPKDGAARFLLAYHLITLGHIEDAATQLRTVTLLNPNDRLAADLLELISDNGQDAEKGAEPPGTAPPTQEKLQGEWKARRPEGKIELDIEGDEFAWDYDLTDNEAEFKGKFYLAHDVMVFAAADGSQMVGRAGMNGDKEFTFRLITDDEDDPGILFQRE